MVARACEFLTDYPVTRIRSAVYCERDKRLAVATTEAGWVVVFLARNYDNKGNLQGPFAKIGPWSDRACYDAFYILAYDNRTPETIAREEALRAQALEVLAPFLTDTAAAGSAVG
jgi:hypothetical protein